MPIPRSALLAIPLAALMAFACTDAPAEPLAPDDAAASRVTAGASFDWTMPPRFGLDRDGDGLIDYSRTAEELRPSAWRVDFEACDLPGRRYVWYVDRVPVARVASCAYTHFFPAEGAYDVTLKVERAPGPTVWAEQVVTVQDWLVISFGDSYASGEGVPEVPQANDALVGHIEGLFHDLADAREHLRLAELHLQEAFEAKGLAEDILATARARRAAFQDACSDVEGWSDIVDCKNFLAERALSFELYGQARDHFQQAVENAQERVDSLTRAWEEARLAVDAARGAVDNLVGALDAARSGFTDPVWQEPYAGEDWGDENCHRSARAAPARAALALENADPRTSVTFIHLACSGAKIDGVTGQVDRAIALAGAREIDAVFLSIGGNDAGFANLAVGCSIQELCKDDEPALDLAAWEPVCSLMRLVGLGAPCDAVFDFLPDRSAKHILEGGLAVLPARYATLAGVDLPGLTGLLEPEAGGPGRDGRGRVSTELDAVDRLRAERIYITEYVDMTHDDTGAYCGPFDPTQPLGLMPGFSVPEIAWLDQTAAGGINDAVAAAAEDHGWTYVSGIYEGYRPRGYCAPTHWVVRAHETFLAQGDHFGIAHPNRAGHEFNGARLFEAVAADLYPAGPTGAPRAPDRPRTPILTAGATE